MSIPSRWIHLAILAALLLAVAPVPASAQDSSTYPEFVSAECTTPLFAGHRIAVRLEVEPYTEMLDLEVQIVPSDFTIVPWEGETHAVFFNQLATVVDFGIDTEPVREDITLTLAFNMIEEVTNNILRSIDCTIEVIGTDNPMPTPTATADVTSTPTPTETPDTTPIPTSTPRPTRTPAPTSTVVPGSHLESIRAQAGARSGQQSRVSFCLVDPAPTGGTVVSLSSSHPNLLAVPATVVVNGGARCRGLVLEVGDSNRSVVVTRTAELDGFSVSAQTTVRPERPYVSTQVVSRSGGTSKVTVCMRAAAGFGGATVPLTSSDPAIFPVPDLAVIGEGSACQSIVVQVGDVQSDTTITVTASFAEGTRSGQTIVRILDPQPKTAEETAVAPTEAPSLTPVALPTGLPIASPVS